MRRERTNTAVATLIALTLLFGCDQTGTTGLASESQSGLAPGGGGPSLTSGKKLNASAVCDPTRGGFTPTATNPFYPIQVGSQWQYEGVEGGELIHLQVTVLNATAIVAGVTTQIIEERETADGDLTEISRNFFAQASDGSVCYFGEDVDIYEHNTIVSHEGSWRADQPGNGPGIFMPGSPKPGMTYQIEIAPGVAEDEGKIVGQGPVTVPVGTFTRTLRVREFNPLDGEKDYKFHAAGVGLVIDGVLGLVSYHL